MRSVLRSTLLATVVLAAGATAALAASPHTGCPAGPSGGGSTTISAWQPMDLAALTFAIVSTGGDAAIAQAEFDAADKNGDEMVCTMRQDLPNDASGSSIWFVSRDNNAAAR